MADILQDVRALNENDASDTTEIKGLVKMLDKKYNSEWEEANFLGRGTVTCSQIFYTSPSRCAVADSCAVSLDRRMTAGETWQSCSMKSAPCRVSRNTAMMSKSACTNMPARATPA